MTAEVQASLIWVVGRHFEAIWLAVATHSSPTTHSATTGHCRRSCLCTCDRGENLCDRGDEACRGYFLTVLGVGGGVNLPSGRDISIADIKGSHLHWEVR